MRREEVERGTSSLGGTHLLVKELQSALGDRGQKGGAMVAGRHQSGLAHCGAGDTGEYHAK